MWTPEIPRANQRSRFGLLRRLTGLLTLLFCWRRRMARCFKGSKPWAATNCSTPDRRLRLRGVVVARHRCFRYGSRTNSPFAFLALKSHLSKWWGVQITRYSNQNSGLFWTFLITFHIINMTGEEPTRVDVLVIGAGPSGLAARNSSSHAVEFVLTWKIDLCLQPG